MTRKEGRVFFCMVLRLKALHLCIDCDLFMAFEESLRMVGNKCEEIVRVFMPRVVHAIIPMAWFLLLMGHGRPGAIFYIF